MASGEIRNLVGFIHTVPSTIGMVEAFMRRYLPGTGWVHIYDGTIRLANFASPVGVTPRANLLRYAEFGERLERAGCGAIVSCCSLMPRATAYGAQAVSVPFVQLDAPLFDQAVGRHARIGVVTTTPYTVPYVEEGLYERARIMGREIEIVHGGDGSALELFAEGRMEEYDAIVIEATRGLARRGVDCILMGQIPLALLEERLGNLDLGVPVLCAGERAFVRIRELLADDACPGREVDEG